MDKRQPTTEPFPSVADENASDTERPATGRQPSTAGSQIEKTRTLSSASNFEQRPRRISIARAFLESNPPNGFMQATGEVASKAPTLGEIRAGSFSHDGWTEEGQREHRGTDPHEIQRKRRERTSSASTRSRGRGTLGAPSPTMERHLEEDNLFPPTPAQPERIPTTIREHEPTSEQTHRTDIKPIEEVTALNGSASGHSAQKEDGRDETKEIGPDETGTYPNGYRFPPKHTWKEATVIGLRAFWKFTWTPFGFLIVIYGLNVVAWGAMIFFVLLEAAPALCHPSCNARNSPRKIWIEIDAQVLTGLFCVTAFGLIPWRFRDLYWLLKWRLFKSNDAFRRLAGIHRGWFRLEGSELLDVHLGPPPLYTKKNPQTPASPPPYAEEEVAELEANPALPLPAYSIPQAPLTGLRAPPTKPWKLDFVIWMYVWNTFIQVILCGGMWGLNRFQRPSALIGASITAGCLVAIAAGLMVFFEGKKVKKVEGISVQEEEIIADIEKDQQEKHDRASQRSVDLATARFEKKKGKHWYERH